MSALPESVTQMPGPQRVSRARTLGFGRPCSREYTLGCSRRLIQWNPELHNLRHNNLQVTSFGHRQEERMVGSLPASIQYP